MKHDRRAVAGMLAALGATTVGPALAQGKTVEVTMKNDPRALFITHTVTFDPGQAVNKEDVALPAGAAPFGSGDMEEDATFSHTFTVKGTYKYVCKYHEAMGMVGTVIVS